MTARAVLLLVLALAAPIGCAAPTVFTRAGDELRASGDYDLIDGLVIPRVDGAAGCGAQALAAVLAFDDPALAPEALGAALPWHEVGATPVDLLLEARAHRRTAVVRAGTMDDLVAAVAERRPVLVMIDARPELRTIFGPAGLGPVMHWSVVTGVARDGSRVLLGAPDDRHGVVERDAFERRWDAADRCMILVAPARSSSVRTGA